MEADNKEEIRRRTKILATINPDRASKAVIKAMINAGMDATRHNFSHSTVEKHIKTIELIREVSKDIRPVGIVVDLQGPKLRILGFKDNKTIQLKTGQVFTLDISCGENEGSDERVGLDYKKLVDDVKAGDTLALADGLIKMRVRDKTETEIICEVMNDGELSGHKGINKTGGGLSAPSLTEKDRADIKAVAHLQPDYFALSFVKSEDDIFEMKAILKKLNCHAGIIAKIERNEAIKGINRIIKAAEVIMIARGDLGVEVTDPHLPGLQKRFIKQARKLNRCVITATQMMESMIKNPTATRAEVFDVANAVLDGTDAVMLSGETAMGDYPIKVIETMAGIILGAEQEKQSRVSHHRILEKFTNTEETVAMSTMYAVNHHYNGVDESLLKKKNDDSDDEGEDEKVKPTIRAIISLTESGQTSIYMSRISSGVSIFALSENIETIGKLTLYRGVYPVFFESKEKWHDQIVAEVVSFLREQFPEYIKSGDQVVITKGSQMGVKGGTNMIQVVDVE